MYVDTTCVRLSRMAPITVLAMIMVESLPAWVKSGNMKHFGVVTLTFRATRTYKCLSARNNRSTHLQISAKTLSSNYINISTRRSSKMESQMFWSFTVVTCSSRSSPLWTLPILPRILLQHSTWNLVQSFMWEVNFKVTDNFKYSATKSCCRFVYQLTVHHLYCIEVRC